MPWKNESPMEQKRRFINLAQMGHFTVTELCEEFGITRKTGHKWLERYAAGGMEGLEERSRAPRKVTNRTCVELERLIVSEKRLHLTWGPKKIQRVLMHRTMKAECCTPPSVARGTMPKWSPSWTRRRYPLYLREQHKPAQIGDRSAVPGDLLHLRGC